jgi:hypothetical protein
VAEADSPTAQPDAHDRVRIEIAFEGGQTIGAVVSDASARELRDALDGERNGVFELEADDGSYLIPVRSVVYVKRFSRETHIGFGRAR